MDSQKMFNILSSKGWIPDRIDPNAPQPAPEIAVRDLIPIMAQALMLAISGGVASLCLYSVPLSLSGTLYPADFWTAFVATWLSRLAMMGTVLCTLSAIRELFVGYSFPKSETEPRADVTGSSQLAGDVSSPTLAQAGDEPPASISPEESKPVAAAVSDGHVPSNHQGVLLREVMDKFSEIAGTPEAHRDSRGAVTSVKNNEKSRETQINELFLSTCVPGLPRDTPSPIGD